MKAANLHEIKRELGDRSTEDLAAVCLRLAKYKVENKELLTYLLYEAGDEAGYVDGTRREISEAFAAIPNTNLYYFKKSLRRILRIVNKHSRYSGQPTTELDLRLHFCTCLHECGVDFARSPVIVNLYNQQLKKVRSLLSSLPEDLRMDYQQSAEKLGAG
jgi:hypothetical protein